MKTRDQMFKTRPDGRLSNTPKSKSQLRRMEHQKEGRRDVTMPSPEIRQVTSVCLYCGDSYPASFKGSKCPKCDTPI